MVALGPLADRRSFKARSSCRRLLSRLRMELHVDVAVGLGWVSLGKDHGLAGKLLERAIKGPQAGSACTRRSNNLLPPGDCRLAERSAGRTAALDVGASGVVAASRTWQLIAIVWRLERDRHPAQLVVR